MTYQRVLPRDLFNEAKLLKCLGKLIIDIERYAVPLTVEHDEPSTGFRVVQDENDGSIFVSNIHFYAYADTGKRLCFYAGLNARDNWPLLVIDEYGDEALEVFDNEGYLSQRFINWVKAL